MAVRSSPKTPPRRNCHAVIGHQVMVEMDSGYRQVQQLIEQDVDERIASREEAEEKRTEVITIPVVVHVVYDDEDGNISDEQIHGQIDVLNQDYRARNVDLETVPTEFQDLVADTRIEFQLAVRDPQGDPTTGITRRKTDRSSFDFNLAESTGPKRNPVKFERSGGTRAWPRNKYLNIWVCNLESLDGITLLGYAQFPGGPHREDGVVINRIAFGTEGTASSPFDKGRTATHEVGHWLNLRHIWGDDEGCVGTDFVDDTPNQAGPNYGSPAHPRPSCGSTGDLFMDYMDYVDDGSMMMFTEGQSMRMDATLAGPRAPILRSNGLVPPEDEEKETAPEQ